MEDSLLDRLQKLQGEIRRLQSEISELTEQADRLEADNNLLRHKAEETEKKLARAELDIEYLRISHRLAEDPDSIIETRRHIAGLIRNIDRCLEMLRE